MENLKFSRTEMAAILYWAGLMAAADGKAHPNEVKMMVNEANRFGISVSDNKSLLDLAGTMTAESALAEVATMSDAQKRYVCAYLGTLMAVDGNIDDKEMALWQMVSSLCKLPTMNIADAIHYMAN